MNPKFDNQKLYENYIQLKKIINSNILSIEQKEWLNNFFNEMKNIDIKDIKIGKNKKGKDNKLELVLDLDNTCIFSFLSNQDLLLVDNIKKHYKKKGAKLLSFEYNKKVLYLKS